MRERGLLKRLALLAREAYKRGEPGYEMLAEWVEREAQFSQARGEEADEEALWAQALEEVIAKTIQKALKKYGLPHVIVDLERGGYVGSYERPSPGDRVWAETKEAAKRKIVQKWVKQVLEDL